MADRQGSDDVARQAALEILDASIDAALEWRCRLHRDRKADVLPVKTYLAGLRAVRDVEDALEPHRRKLGATSSRAFETHMTGSQLRERATPLA
jgi:hypothetical protein